MQALLILIGNQTVQITELERVIAELRAQLAEPAP